MIKSQLIQKLADENPHLTQSDCTRIVDVFFNTIIDAMANKDRVEIRGFGVFESREQKGRTGRNPRTGETVMVPTKRKPVFKTGKELRDRLNGRV